MDESRLILRAQNGDKEAFQSLIALYYPYISKFLLKLTTSEQLSEDLTQETLLRIIRSIDKFDVYGSAAFSTYVMSIAKNLYIDHLRKNRQSVLNIDEQDIPSQISLQDAVLHRMQFQDVLKLLDTLPEQQAIPIRMKYLEQLTLAEIADRLNCEPKTIKSRIHHGMVKLRKLLRTGEMDHG